MSEHTSQQLYSFGRQLCSFVLGLLSLFWLIVLGYWVANFLRGGIDTARAWLMHVALLGVPFEQRTVPETIQRIHGAYERLIILLLMTCAVCVLRNFFRSRERKRRTVD